MFTVFADITHPEHGRYVVQADDGDIYMVHIAEPVHEPERMTLVDMPLSVLLALAEQARDKTGVETSLQAQLFDRALAAPRRPYLRIV